MDLTNEGDISEPSSSKPVDWTVVGQHVLTEDDRDCLMSGEWLNDKHINAAQQLLKERYPIISGFQDTTLQLTRTYHIQKGKIFVQILHVNHNHWVTISTVNCGPNTVKIYDTMHEELSMESKTVIADLLQTSERYIKLMSRGKLGGLIVAFLPLLLLLQFAVVNIQSSLKLSRTKRGNI